MADSANQKSTIVRAFGRRIAAARTGLRTLERVTPGLAARLAARWWFTPPHPRRRRTAVAGQRFLTPLAADPTWATRTRWQPPVGRRFAVPAVARGLVVAQVWGQGPTAYLLHGWGGWRGQFAHLIEPLVVAGLRVVALDTLGHGESGSGRLGGRRSTLVEAAEALTAVASVTGPAHAIIAHSAGCQAAALAVRCGLAADRLVFLAPMRDPMPYARQFATAVGLGPRTWPRFIARVERTVGRPLTDFDLPRQAAGADRALPPLLVIHDRHDRDSAYHDGAAVARAWPGAQLMTTSGLGHRRLLADPDVIDATVAFAAAQRTAEPRYQGRLHHPGDIDQSMSPQTTGPDDTTCATARSG